MEIISVKDVREYGLKVTQSELDHFYRVQGQFNAQFKLPVVRLLVQEHNGTSYEIYYTVRLEHSKWWEDWYMEGFVTEKRDLRHTACKECQTGQYQETTINDDWDGVLHCCDCNHCVSRYEKVDRRA